ncbi:MAG TPA: hypothetical protein VMU83_11090 [Hanamia sp.]|nr:hypothetical protein [Hanamia sp.]
MKLNPSALTVKRSVVVASIIGLVPVSYLLANKKKSKRVKKYNYVVE